MNVRDRNAAIGTKDKAICPKIAPFNSIGNAAWLILLCAISQFATAQVKHGTIVMWMATPTDFVMTADSRISVGGFPNIFDIYRDDECKIRAFDNHLAFAAAGDLAEISDVPGVGWDAREIAAHLARERVILSAADIDIVATVWAWQTQAAINHTPPSPREDGERTVLEVVFAGSVGIPKRIHVVEVLLEVGGQPKINLIDPSDPANPAIRVYGSGAQLFTIYLMETPGATNGLFRAQDSRAYTKDDLIRITYKVTGFAVIESNFLGPVGGPIDQLFLGASGIDWLHKKQQCQ